MMAHRSHILLSMKTPTTAAALDNNAALEAARNAPTLPAPAADEDEDEGRDLCTFSF